MKMGFVFVIEQKDRRSASAPNTACTGRLGLGAFFGAFSELWRFSVFEPIAPQPPVTPAVGQFLAQNHLWVKILDEKTFSWHSLFSTLTVF
jgi:hypothetical protein